MPYADPERQRAYHRSYMREWYSRNGKRHRDYVRAHKQQHRRTMYALVRAIKETTPCVDCRQVYAHYIMDFDHVDNNKRASVSRLITTAAGEATIRLEMKKCELVCANCHRTRTWKRGFGLAGAMRA